MVIRTIKNNITRLQVDAIVNAANCQLFGGGNGAIHGTTGPELRVCLDRLQAASHWHRQRCHIATRRAHFRGMVRQAEWA